MFYISYNKHISCTKNKQQFLGAGIVAMIAPVHEFTDDKVHNCKPKGMSHYCTVFGHRKVRKCVVLIQESTIILNYMTVHATRGSINFF